MADVINRGLAPGDKSADSAYVGAGKINEKFAEIDAGGSFSRLNISNVLLTASFRSDENGNLGWYVGAAGAADGEQVKVATINKATGGISVRSGFNVSADNPRAWIAHTGAIPSTLGFGADAGATWLGPHTNSDFYIITNNAERMRVGAAGNVTLSGDLEIKNAYAELRFHDLNAAADVRAFSIISTLGYLHFSRLNDAGGWLSSPMTIDHATSAISFSGLVLPNPDNAISLGAPGARWSVVYAGTGTINTSDAREKTPVRNLSTAELAAARDLAGEIGVYQWLTSIEEKGEDGSRLHIGLTVQRAIDVMESHGLDPWRYGFICRDDITRKVKVTQTQTVQATEDVEEAYSEIEIRDGVPVQVQKTRIVQQPKVVMIAVVDEDGRPVERGGEPLLHPVPVMEVRPVEVEIDEPAGDRLGFRYDQLTLFMLRGLLARVEALEA